MSYKMQVIENLLADRQLRVVRAEVESVKIGPAAPVFSFPAYNQSIFILNIEELPPNTLIESDTNTRRYHTFGAPESAYTLDEFSGLVTIRLQDNAEVFGPQRTIVHNIVYARVLTEPLP